MTVGIVGLGLIGGSAAKAYKAAKHRVLATDIDSAMLDFAVLYGAVDQALTDQNISQCDIVLIAVYPKAARQFIVQNAPHFNKNGVVLDFCGTKKDVCDCGFEQAEQHGFLFVGGHPMAGSHNSGFKHSREDLFDGAPMVLVPPIYDDMQLLDRITSLLSPLQFGRISVTTANKHDAMIAFTSQMPHVLSNSFIKSPTALSHKGFSAGSYRDFTRVAWLNPDMWAQLFIENKEHLLQELDIFTQSLAQYRQAIADGDKQALVALLDEGKLRKEEVDGR